MVAPVAPQAANAFRSSSSETLNERLPTKRRLLIQSNTLSCDSGRKPEDSLTRKREESEGREIRHEEKSVPVTGSADIRTRVALPPLHLCPNRWRRPVGRRAATKKPDPAASRIGRRAELSVTVMRTRSLTPSVYHTAPPDARQIGRAHV